MENATFGVKKGPFGGFLGGSSHYSHSHRDSTGATREYIYRRPGLCYAHACLHCMKTDSILLASDVEIVVTDLVLRGYLSSDFRPAIVH